MSRAGGRLRAAASAVLVMAASALAAGSANAASGDVVAPPGASSCSGCHATHAGSLLPAIQGRPADEIVAALEAFRTGKRPATVMNRIAPGFTESESRAIATWLSAQPVPQ